MTDIPDIWKVRRTIFKDGKLTIPKPVLDEAEERKFRKRVQEKRTKHKKEQLLMPTWLVIIKPSLSAQKLIEKDLIADGYNPANVWYDVMENLVFAVYIKAQNKTQAKKLTIEAYGKNPMNVGNKKSETEIIVKETDNFRVPEGIYVLQGHELRKLIMNMW